MRPFLFTLAAIATSGLLSLAAAGPAAAAQRSCGTVKVFDTPVRIVTLRGVTCTTAKRVARGLHNGGVQRSGWQCGLAHAPFSKIDGRDVAFSCAKGGRSGNLRRWPHAFVGTLPTSSGGGDTTPTR